MTETVQLVFEVRKDTVDSAAKSLNDLKNKANAVSKSLEKLKSASGMKAIANLNAKINKQSEQLSKLNVELSKTKTKLTNVKSGFKDQVNSLKHSEKATKDQVTMLKAHQKAQAQVNKTNNVAIAAMGKAVQAAGAYEETIKKLKAELAKLRGEQEKGITGVQKMDAAIREANNSINKQNGLLAQLSSSHKAQNILRTEGKSILRDYDQQLKAVEMQLKGVISEEQRDTLESQKNKIVTEQQIVAEKQHLAILAMKRANMKALTGVMNKFASTVRAVGMTMSRYLTTAMSAAIVMGVKMAANIEAQIVRFGVLTGQMEKGARLYEQIVEFSARTPFLLPDLGKAAQTLLAFGSPLSSVMDELQRLGDLAMGDTEKLEGIVTSFGKVRSRGTAHMRELNRFIMSGVPIIQELNKNIGVTGEELFKMVERNEITFEHIEKAVQSLTNEGGRFHDMTLQVSETLEGRFSTALDNLRLDLASLFDPFVDGIKEVLVQFIDWSQGFRALSEGARKEIAKLVTALALIGPALIALAGAVKVVTWAFTALNVVINPIGASLRIILGIVTAIIAKKTFDKLKDSLDRAGENAKKLAEYTETLNEMQEYSKDNVVPGLSEELFTVAKKYDLVKEAVIRLLQAEELREKLNAGFEVTPEFKEAEKGYKRLTSLFSGVTDDITTMSGNLQQLWMGVDTAYVAEQIQKDIDSIIRRAPEFSDIVESVFGTTDVTALSSEELGNLDTSKLYRTFDDFFRDKEGFLSEAGDKWRENLAQQIADLVSPEGLLEQEGITPESIKSDFYKLLQASFSGIDQAMIDYESGLSSTSTLINKYRNQQTQIMRALKRVRDSAVEEAINMGGARERRAMGKPDSLIAKETAAAKEVIDALDENIKALLRTRMSEIKSETEGTNLLRAMLGLTDDKDTIKVLENQIDGLVKLIQEITDFSYAELLEMDRNDLPELVDEIVDEIDDLKAKLDVQLRHKERINLFEAFFEGDIKDTEIAMLESKIKEAVDTLSTAIANPAGDTESLTDVIFGHMQKGTINEFISGLDEATQEAFNTVSGLYARLQSLTEEAKTNTSLIQAFIGGEDEFAEYIRKLNLDKAIRNFDTELQKHITDDRSATDILSILLGGEIPDDLQPLMPLLDIINEFKDEIKELSAMDIFLDGMAKTLEGSVIPAFEKLGESIALGATGMEAMGSAIGSIGQAIMNALPELLFKAGVDVMADDWRIGTGLIAASGIVAGLNGYLGASVSESKITETPANTISYSAKGDVFGNGYIARGPIGRSTNYGVSVIGEAGDEAVMPLTRGSGGKLGVAGMGGNVYVTVNNNSNAQVETKESTNSDGSKSIEFLVYDTVKKGMASGEFDRSMANSYGIARRGRY